MSYGGGMCYCCFIVCVVDGRKYINNVIKIFQGSVFDPQIPHFISPISNININSTATSHHTPPPFQMERNHHQRPKRMRGRRKYGTKEKFLCRNSPPAHSKINIAIGPYSYTDTHLMLFGYTTPQSEQNWNQISLGILLNSILYLYCYLVDI